VPELAAGRPQPWRVVFSDHPGTLPCDAPLIRDATRTLIRPRGNLAAALRSLVDEQGVLSAMMEAGGTLAGCFAAEGLIDEVVIYLAPMLCGGPVPALGDPALPGRMRLVDPQYTLIPNSRDIRLRACVANAAE
jgi:diaminohydroxyphosphoribosylaminopyrimidine deaminase / 5-amino-6-(5-phosphoribosylamino)uracil reductase